MNPNKIGMGCGTTEGCVAKTPGRNSGQQSHASRLFLFSQGQVAALAIEQVFETFTHVFMK
ncbi:MAG: hypothetical protein ACJ8AG_19015 [Ktedonobacteraceae bacterium]